MPNAHLSPNLTVEEKLRRSEKEIDNLKHALDCSTIVAFTDPRGVITYVNDRFCEISKYDRKEIIGNTHRLVNSGYHSSSFFEEMWRTISNGHIWKGEIKNRAKDGTYYWVHTTIVPFMTAQGRPFRYVAIRTDITEEKHMREVSEQYRATLQETEKLASLGELAAGITHELANPLTAMKGRLELFQEQMATRTLTVDDAKQFSDSVARLTDRMNSIIRCMRSLARNSSDEPFERVNLSQLVRDVVGIASETFHEKGIKIEVVSTPEDLEMICQETQIGQVLVNLINNARDAVQTLPEKWIRISIEDLGDAVRILVTDSGKGIPNEIADQIMTPLFTTKPKRKGLGLGLSISKSIIDKHRGHLWLDSNQKNTQFVIELPKTVSLFH